MRASESRTEPEIASRTLGVVLAGGRSRRFGGPKALATLAGVPLVARAATAVAAATPRAVVITGDPATARAAKCPARPDRVPGMGPLGGLLTALEWASELGDVGVLLVGVDMPFLDAGVLRRLLENCRPPATVPIGDDGLHMQPLCAWYAVDVLPVVLDRVATGRLQLRDLLSEVGAHRIPETAVAGARPRSLVFMNVNTREDLREAERAAAGAEIPHG